MKTFKDFNIQLNENFEDWMKTSKSLNDIVNKSSEKLNTFTKSDKGSGGLVPDEVRASSEFKKLKKDYDLAFHNLRTFNKQSSNAYKRKASKLKRNCR